MRGILLRNKESKIYADGRTYDSKLYTFKECDYRQIWHTLDIMVKVLDSTKPLIKNIEDGEGQIDEKVKQKQKKERIDKALAKEGVPNPNNSDDELSSSDDDEFDDYDLLNMRNQPH